MPDGAPHTAPVFGLDNSYARDLPGTFVAWRAARVAAPRLLKLNRELAEELGLDTATLDGPLGAEVFSGNLPPSDAEPLAQAYAGHQFGGFSPQLGDGRALLLGEVIDRKGRRRDIALKGSGQTPFSRRGDGKAAIGPVLREYLIGEAMHALGIPTTRALAAVATGEQILRDTALPGAVLTRVAASHIRVGTFQFFAARGDRENLAKLTTYTLARHYPAVASAEPPALALLGAVTEAQAQLIAQWMAVGFIHGVMNTDNMTLSGETIDYGPCAFMDAYAPGTVFSSIDHQGRYAYGNQPGIAQWNLARLAEALLPLIDPNEDRAVERATDVLQGFVPAYERAWTDRMRAKLGLAEAEDGDAALALGLLAIMEAERADWTLVFRRLSRVAQGDASAFRLLFGNPAAVDDWLTLWQARCMRDGRPAEVRAAAMDRVNPLVIPRNHKVEEAIAAAVWENDLAPFEALLDQIQRPFEEMEGREAFVLPPPQSFTENFRTFCGT
ncbi:YdiU family protein [Tabrizicola sp. J26]|uniref:protein adenylyltransferase SelO n=1 Tax=Alitabrizicola rongguiensis TaxID=2909234 RepID=UPI001F36BE74|nr:YdiU family protein [Tabrizicola rongguiensis]MCF1709481.1 YdiU family protein [Tabrizicola rongguiensis]